MTTRTEREFAKNTGYMQGVGDEVRLHLFNLADRVDKLTAERDAAEVRVSTLIWERSDYVQKVMDERDTLRTVGSQMANVMFNLSQRPNKKLTDDVCATMKSLQQQWDAARAKP